MQSSDEQMKCLDTHGVILVNKHCTGTAFVVNQQGGFQVMLSLPHDLVEILNCLKVPFVEVLTRWLCATKTLSSNFAFTDVEELREVSALD